MTKTKKKQTTTTTRKLTTTPPGFEKIPSAVQTALRVAYEAGSLTYAEIEETVKQMTTKKQKSAPAKKKKSGLNANAYSDKVANTQKWCELQASEADNPTQAALYKAAAAAWKEVTVIRTKKEEIDAAIVEINEMYDDLVNIDPASRRVTWNFSEIEKQVHSHGGLAVVVDLFVALIQASLASHYPVRQIPSVCVLMGSEAVEDRKTTNA